MYLARTGSVNYVYACTICYCDTFNKKYFSQKVISLYPVILYSCVIVCVHMVHSDMHLHVYILYIVYCTYVYTYVCYSIMEYGSTPYVGLTRKKHVRHTLAQILFSSEN